MHQAVVYGYLRQNKDKLNDMLGRLATDLINLGSIPTEACLVGDKVNWRLLAHSDARAYALATKNHLQYLCEYSEDRTGILALLHANNGDLTAEISSIFKPLLELWADAAKKISLDRLSTHQQLLSMEEHLKTLQKVEVLALSALSISISDKIELLRTDEERINAEIRHYQVKLVELNKIKEVEIPKVQKDIAAHQTLVASYYKEIEIITKKQMMLSEFAKHTKTNLKQLYPDETLYPLMLKEQKILNVEQNAETEFANIIEEIKSLIQQEKVKIDLLQDTLANHQHTLNMEVLNQNAKGKLASWQERLNKLNQYRAYYDEKSFMPIALEEFKLMLKSYRNSEISYLQARHSDLLLTEEQLVAILNFYSVLFKERNYQALGHPDWLVPFVRNIQRAGRNQYDISDKSLNVGEHRLVEGEFYSREIDKVITLNELTDAGAFMRVLIGAFYIANHRMIDRLPKEITDYVEELKTQKQLTQSTQEIFDEAVRGLNEFILAPNHYACTEMEREILNSALKDPTLGASNVRFFSRPPQANTQMEVIDESERKSANIK